MVWLAGPRQVGKTTLALSLQGAADGYLSWDAPEDRERIFRRRLPESDLSLRRTALRESRRRPLAEVGALPAGHAGS